MFCHGFADALRRIARGAPHMFRQGSADALRISAARPLAAALPQATRFPASFWQVRACQTQAGLNNYYIVSLSFIFAYFCCCCF